MPKDAKLGLVVGVALVIAVAVVFFRKDGTGQLIVAESPAPHAANPAQAPASRPEPPPPPNQLAVGEKVPTGHPAGRSHLIRASDTLYSIAREHYGDGDRFHELYLANRDVLKTPDALPVGRTIRIP
jgi:nucleoid-associated protein YgaU